MALPATESHRERSIAIRDSCSAAWDCVAPTTAAPAATPATLPGVGEGVGGVVGRPVLEGVAGTLDLTSRLGEGVNGFFCDCCEEIEERIVGNSDLGFSGGDDVVFLDIAGAPFATE